jgi:hypothetical protein
MSRPQANVRRVVVKLFIYWRRGEVTEFGRVVVS